VSKIFWEDVLKSVTLKLRLIDLFIHNCWIKVDVKKSERKVEENKQLEDLYEQPLRMYCKELLVEVEIIERRQSPLGCSHCTFCFRT
jgi:hypothetical protein